MSIFTNPYLASIFISDNGEKFTLLEVIKKLSESVFDEVDTRLDTLEGQITAQEDSIEDVGNQLSSVQNNINALNTRVGNTEGDISDMHTAISNLNINELQRRLATAESEIDTAKTAINQLGGSLDDLNGEVI